MFEIQHFEELAMMVAEAAVEEYLQEKQLDVGYPAKRFIVHKLLNAALAHCQKQRLKPDNFLKFFYRTAVQKKTKRWKKIIEQGVISLWRAKQSQKKRRYKKIKGIMQYCAQYLPSSLDIGKTEQIDEERREYTTNYTFTPPKITQKLFDTELDENELDKRLKKYFRIGEKSNL